MVRLARFSPAAFVEAAVALVAEGGPSAASTAAIARRVGAPTGSVYHRFESRAAVLATAWIDVHDGFSARVLPRLETGRGLDAALALLAWARAERVRARFLLLNEPGALFDDAPPPDGLRAEIARRELAVDAAFAAFLGTDPALAPEAAARWRFLVFDGPIALLRPHLLGPGPVPAFLDEVVREMHGAVRPAAAAPAPRREDAA
jgi:AcrR family transcriptional regulator